MHELSIKATNYKCFRSESGFDSICRVNLIIGRNNSGKSSLLDIIEIVVSGKYVVDQTNWRKGQRPNFIFEATITREDVDKVFAVNTSGGTIRGNHNTYGKAYIGKTLKWSKDNENTDNSNFIECDDEGIDPPLKSAENYAQVLSNRMPIPLEGKVFRRLLAERDILPEKSQPKNLTIGTNGAGITNVIQNFINRSDLPSDLVESSLLSALNSIFSHDAFFTDVVCQLHGNEDWEIFLEEEFKGRIALSNSGSGLKTVISVLACLVLVPHLEGKPLSEYVFGFEELENNIHPALLRRLNDYIYRLAKEKDFSYFLTTHSNVLIDQFSKQNDAQIVHVALRESVATCTTANTYIKNHGILDDLDVRASDLLQANGIIWVEGPSDRIYLNRWISLWSDGELKEGSHYQIIFYGGRLLSHLSADDPGSFESGISILNTNRNAIMLIDSDKKNRQASINATKQRIDHEFSKLQAFCWITKGKEIENYIPSDVVDSLCEVSNSKQVGQYDSFFDYLDEISVGEGSKYIAKKPLLAEKLIPYMNKANLTSVLDMDKCMIQACKEIQAWNS